VKKPDPQHHFVVRASGNEIAIWDNFENAVANIMKVKDDFYTGLKFAVRCSPLAVPDYAELKSCLVNCDKNNRYFDLDEIV
jgi:hypothetical protein